MLPKSKKLLSTILIAHALISTNVLARQWVEGSAERHVEVNVSAHEQNLLSIDGRRIGSVVPSQPIVHEKDEAAGAFYFFFPKEAGTVTLFVTDEQNPMVKYKLILVPKPIAGEDVVIKPIATTPTLSDPKGKALSYQRRVKDLMLTMTDESSNADFIEVNQVIPLWKEARLTFLSKYVTGDMVGEKYRLTNVSKNEMVLAEQELYRSGVIAVAIENHTLQNDAQTLIYVVRTRNEHE